VRAMKAQGAASLAALLDQHFDRLPAPAFAALGDVLLFAGEDGRSEPLGALCISDGFDNVLGWHDAGTGFGSIVGTPGHAVAGWAI